MRVLASVFGIGILFLCTVMVWVAVATGQNQPTPSTHVIIPNPTPRQPDLQKELGDNPRDQKKREALLLQSQLRAREIWLESNQILLLAQQLQQEIRPGKKSPSMAANAVKVGKIEKLAQSVQEKMRTH
jgi:hypothetical protein